MDKNKKWTHYLTRPFSLFGASLWVGWYISAAFRDVFGFTVQEQILVEKSPGLVGYYRQAQDLKQFENIIIHLLTKERKKCLNYLKEGRKLNEKARKILQGREHLPDMERAVDFFNEMAVKAVILPTFVGKYMDELGIEDRELVQLVEELKSISYYPQFIEEVLRPYAQKKLMKMGVHNQKAADVITIDEILNGKVYAVKSRLTQRSRGNVFVYEVQEAAEYMDWMKSTASVVRELEGGEKHEGEMELKGICAFAGKVRGRARIINTNDVHKVRFNPGDIIVAVSTNPTLMPLLIQCAGIVTDEGGMLSHAAIIARELKKPCVIGIKRATTLIKEGEMLDVDAEKGVVRKIK